MDDKDLHDKILELQDEVCIISNHYSFIQLSYRTNFILNQQVFFFL